MNESLLGVGEFSKEYASPAIFERLIINEYIINIVTKLTTVERQVLIMSFFDRIPLRGIAGIMGMSLSAVERAKKRAVKRLFYLILEEKNLL